MKIRFNERLLLPSLFLAVAAALGSSAAAAEDVHENLEYCSGQSINYKSCDNHKGWYVGGELGVASTNISGGDIDRFYNLSGLEANSIDINDNDTSYALSAGYQFSTFFAAELAYINLGKRSVDFVGKATNKTTFYDNAEHVYPQSGDGTSIAIVGSWPLTETLKLSGKLGYLHWQGDYITHELDQNVGQDSISGNDLWLGVELNYRINDHFQVYLNAQKFELDRDDTTNIGLGLRYYFGDTQAKINKKARPISNNSEGIQEQNIESVAVAVKVDTDKDGVADNIDNCPDSALVYRVDSQGCTLMESQSADFSLVIYFQHDSSRIPVKYQEQLQALAAFIQKYNVANLKVYGHSSSKGPSAYNLKLSKRRALSVAKVLTTDYAIDENIIEAIGKGETQLLDNANTEQADNKNRRMELKIVEKLLLPVKK